MLTRDLPSFQVYCVDSSCGQGRPVVAAAGNFPAVNVYDVRESVAAGSTRGTSVVIALVAAGPPKLNAQTHTHGRIVRTAARSSLLIPFPAPVATVVCLKIIPEHGMHTRCPLTH